MKLWLALTMDWFCYGLKLVLFFSPPFLSYFPGLVWLTDSRFHSKQSEAADSLEACSPKPWCQNALPIKLKGDFAWHLFYSNRKWHYTTTHKYLPNSRQTHLWFNQATETTWWIVKFAQLRKACWDISLLILWKGTQELLLISERGRRKRNKKIWC